MAKSKSKSKSKSRDRRAVPGWGLALRSQEMRVVVARARLVGGPSGGILGCGVSGLVRRQVGWRDRTAVWSPCQQGTSRGGRRWLGERSIVEAKEISRPGHRHLSHCGAGRTNTNRLQEPSPPSRG
jgi:hypothetical protein